MHVTFDIVGGECHEFEVTDETYAQVLDKIGFSPNEVAVIVDGQPVPEDQPVQAEHVRILRLISGG